jgi:hypothetical protein
MRAGPFGLFAVLLCGCAPEEPIRTYTAPKAVEVTYTIHGGCFPAEGEPQWFFKVSGRTAQLAEHKPAIDAFFTSVRPAAKERDTPTWTLPPGWTATGPNPKKFADEVLSFGDKEKPLLLTVSNVRGGLDQNLARWAKQLAAPWGDDAKGKALKPLGTPPIGWQIELTGPNDPAARGPGMGMAR